MNIRTPPELIGAAPLAVADLRAQSAMLRRQNLRIRVLDLVQRGRLTPARAEAWAREHSEGPFAVEPDPALFDPMAEVDWTPAMVAAWIVRRTRDAVRRAWPAYLEEAWRWRAMDVMLLRPAFPGGVRSYRGHVLEQVQAEPAATVLRRFGLDGGPIALTPDEAERELRHALRTGEIVALHGPDAEPIPTRAWAVLSPFAPPRRRSAPDSVFDEDGRSKIERVRFESRPVIHRWPERHVAQDAKPGRPSFEHLWRPEFDRREVTGANAGVEATANALRDWCHDEARAGRITLPADQSIPSVRTIAHAIRRRRKQANDKK